MFYAFEFYFDEKKLGSDGRVPGELNSFLTAESRDMWVAEGIDPPIAGIRVEPFRRMVTLETFPTGYSIKDAFLNNDH